MLMQRQSGWIVCNLWQPKSVGLFKCSLPSGIKVCLGLWKFNYFVCMCVCVSLPPLLLFLSKNVRALLQQTQRRWNLSRANSSLFLMTEGVCGSGRAIAYSLWCHAKHNKGRRISTRAAKKATRGNNRSPTPHIISTLASTRPTCKANVAKLYN